MDVLKWGMFRLLVWAGLGAVVWQMVDPSWGKPVWGWGVRVWLWPDLEWLVWSSWEVLFLGVSGGAWGEWGVGLSVAWAWIFLSALLGLLAMAGINIGRHLLGRRA